MNSDPDKDCYDDEIHLPLDRRQFLTFMGSGITILFSWGDSAHSQERRKSLGLSPESPTDFNAFLNIREDGRVTCFSGKIEMGQGIITSLAQMLAEELDIPLYSIDMIMGDTDLCPWDMGTFGSRSTKFFGPLLRQAAAEAREILMALAAEHLQTSIDRLAVKEGVAIDRGNPERQVSFAHLVRGKKIARRQGKKPRLKSPPTFTISGKPLGRTDALEKVTGQAKFSGDIRLPGMVYAKILRPPAHGAELKKVDASAAVKTEGVRVIREGDLIAVLHAFPDEADRASSKIKAQFALPEMKVNSQTIFPHLLKMAPPGRIIGQEGDLEKGKKIAERTFSATYFQQYVAHAPMETHTAIAKVGKNRVTVWASTQRPFGAREEIARALGLSPQKVRIITPFVGGGFGGKTFNGQAVEAARLAKLARKPVQVAWSREEEFFFDTYQPAAIVQIESGLSRAKQIVFWDYRVYYAGERSAQSFYAVPHHRTTSHGSWWGAPGAHPFATGAWRAPASNTNAFARECHIDFMAAEVGADPLSFRMDHLTDKRMRQVLERVATKFGWSPTKAPSGRGQGLACGIYLGTYVACMAEVEVDKKSGKVTVKRMVCAQDMGQIINPEGAKLQMEGCLMMGLGYALTEEVRFRGGTIHDLNFDTYEIPRFSWLPKIETVLVKNPEVPPQGGGEPPITCTGAVIANALFDATGVRLFQLPLNSQRVKKALAGS